MRSKRKPDASCGASSSGLLDDPQVMAASRELAVRFERLIDQDSNDPEVVAVAELIASQGAAFTAPDSTDAESQTAWELVMQSLTTAQRHAVMIATERWYS